MIIDKKDLYELIDKLPETDVDQVMDFIDYLNIKREKKIAKSKERLKPVEDEVREVLKELMEMEGAAKKTEEKLNFSSIDSETLERERAKAREYSLHERANMISTGYEQGIQQGRDLVKGELAKKLLLKGVDVDIIARATGLDNEKIGKLK